MDGNEGVSADIGGGYSDWSTRVVVECLFVTELTILIAAPHEDLAGKCDDASMVATRGYTSGVLTARQDDGTIHDLIGADGVLSEFTTEVFTPSVEGARGGDGDCEVSAGCDTLDHFGKLDLSEIALSFKVTELTRGGLADCPDLAVGVQEGGEGGTETEGGQISLEGGNEVARAVDPSTSVAQILQSVMAASTSDMLRAVVPTSLEIHGLA